VDEVQGSMLVMEGHTTIGQVHDDGAVQNELDFAEAGEGDLGDEQMDAVTEGSTDPTSKDKANTADAGKNANSSKARKRTKTGCLSKLTNENIGSPSRLICDSMSQAKDQVRGRTTNVQQLCQVQTQL